MRRALLAVALLVPHHARAQGTPAADKDKDNDKAEVTDDDEGESDEKPASGETDDEEEAGEQPGVPHGTDTEAEDEGQGEDEEDHRHHGHIHHEPGLGIEYVAAHARLRLGLAVQPLGRYGHDSIPSPDTMDTTIRRGRVTFDAELTHGTGLRIDVQARDGVVGFADLYGRWALDEHLEIQAGFLGAPGGMERDTNPFDLPFIERSSLASMTHDREVGVKLVGHQGGQFWAASVTRDAPAGFGGDDPDIAPVLPPAVDPTTLTRSATKWNQAARIGTAPSDEFAASIGWSVRIRNSAPDYGDAAYEPNGTVILDGKAYRGTAVRIGADTALSEDNFRILAEAAYRRDGEQLEFDGLTGQESRLPGHVWWAGGYLTAGWTPRGRYGRAVDGAPLQWGWEVVARVETLKVKPVDAFSATLIAETLGLDWVATPHFRLQGEATLQHFGEFDQTLMMDNAGATRFYAQLWATWRL
jgi:hypothetical protein